MEAIEGLRFLASLPLAGTGQTKGGEKSQPFNRFHSRLFISAAELLVCPKEIFCHQTQSTPRN